MTGQAVWPIYIHLASHNYSTCISNNFFIFCPICLKFSHKFQHTYSFILSIKKENWKISQFWVVDPLLSLFEWCSSVLQNSVYRGMWEWRTHVRGLWHSLIETVVWDINFRPIYNRRYLTESMEFNPFPPSVPIWHRLVKLSILI